VVDGVEYSEWGTVVWGQYEPAIRRWEHVLGCPAPPPAEPGPSGRPRAPQAGKHASEHGASKGTNRTQSNCRK